MRRLVRLVETVRHLRLSPAGHRLVRSLGRADLSAPRGASPSTGGLAPLPDVSRRALAAPFDRPEGTAWRIAGALVTPDAAGACLRVEPDPAPAARERALAAGPVRALAEAGDLPGARAWLAALAGARTTARVRAERVLSLVEARGAGLADVEPLLLEELARLARRPPWDEGGLALAWTGTALHRGGAVFAGASSRAWRARGAAILSTCAARQVLSDGVHVERSPVTHALLLEALLVALETSRSLAEAPPRGVAVAAARLAAVLPALGLPDGEPVRARDGAPGEALPCASLTAWAAAQPEAPVPLGPARVRRFPAAGLAILTSADGRSAATLWAAPSCPSDGPGGVHADALATEVVLDGVRVIATAGTPRTGGRTGRERERTPGAFAGLRVDGVATADVGEGAGAGARGWARRLDARAEDAGAFAEAYAGGLPGAARRVVLRRVVRLGNGPCVAFVDEATGGGEHDLSYTWPLLPGLAARLEGDGASIVGLGRTFSFAAPGLVLSLEDGLYARGPGVGERREVLVSHARRAVPTRVVHAIAPGPGPLRVTATPVPGGELRVEVEGAFGRSVGFVPLGRRP